MGFFDSFSSNSGGGLLGGLDDPRQAGQMALAMGLLSASGPSTTPTSFGQAFGKAGLQGMQAMQQAQQLQRENGLRDLQMKQATLGLQKTETDLAKQKRIEDAYKSFYSPASASPSAPTGGMQSEPAAPLDNPAFPRQSMPDWLPKLPAATMPQTTTSKPPAAGSDNYSRHMQFAQYLEGKGLGEEAAKYYDMAEKFKPKYSTTPQRLAGPDGKMGMYQISESGGAPLNIGLNAAPDMVEMDLGGARQWVDKNGITSGQQFKKTQTPDSVASNASAAAGRAQTERHFQSGLNSPQYMETEQGIMALPKKLQDGQSPVGIPVMGTNGAPLQKKQNIPQYVVQGVTGNAKSLQSINSALASLETAEGKNATGWKGYLPNSILNRSDPEGVNTRADISDVGSLLLHDRSGAAVTASESPRLMPFIPLATDDAATAKKKLTRMKQIIEAETNNLTFAYPSAKGLADYATAQPAKQAKAASGGANHPPEIQGLLKKYGG